MYSSFNLRKISLPHLNTITKYPSIPTYHTLGEKGRLTEECPKLRGEGIVTEKIDGTNVRMIFLPNGECLLGSRENLLWADDDLLFDPSQGIVEALRYKAQRINNFRGDGPNVVVFGELYGGNIGKCAKQYTSNGAVDFRIFDYMYITPLMLTMVEEEWNLAQLAAWRDAGEQSFASWDDVRDYTDALPDGLGIETVPDLIPIQMEHLPTTLQETQQFLQAYQQSHAAMDKEAPGYAEGVVIRSPGREWIYKLRFEDYARTLR
jgi:hypothetical protein